MKRSRTDLNFDRRTVCQGVLGLATAAIWAPTAQSAEPATPTVAQTASGKVRGVRQGAIHSFKGVPYGADTSKTRFQKAAPPTPWTGERDATQYGAQAPQFVRSYGDARGLLKSWAIPQGMGEDCLFLNIWTPGLRDGKKRPVMLYIHGGGFSAGSGAAAGYDGTRLAQRGDAVVLTMNHRLNIFGFLYLAEIGGAQYADSGNAGQHDIIMALRWVRDNIEEFGGDPGNVLLFGESGGGMKICTLMAMPEAEGLFHRAVVQSGPLVWGADKNAATKAAREALNVLNVAPNNLQALNDRTAEQILQAYSKLSPQNSLQLAPVVDGRGLPRHPFDPDAPKVSSKVPLMIGVTRTETSFIFGAPKYFTLGWNDVAPNLKKYTGSMDADAIVAKYRELMPKASPTDVFFAATTNLMMLRNVIAICDRKSAQKAAPVYRYELTWETPVDGGKWRSPHTLDIALAFDNVALSESMFGGAPQAQQLADQMSEAWIAFARSGNPNNKAVPTWTAYDSQNRQTLLFDVTSRMQNHRHQAEIEALGTTPQWNATTAAM